LKSLPEIQWIIVVSVREANPLERVETCFHSIKPLETLPMIRCSKVLMFTVCIASVALADDFKTIEGKEYKNVTVSRIEPDGIVLRTKSGISKLYFVELPKEVQERFHYNAAIAAAYSAQQSVNRTNAAVARRGQAVEVISHGASVDINKHLALGSVTLVDFYADWCGPCRAFSPSLDEMAATDPEIALRKIDIVNWKTAVARQFNVLSIPQVNVYNRGGNLIGTVNGPDLDAIKRYVAQAKAGG
jgi:Thiol:disulfide interchange protein